MKKKVRCILEIEPKTLGGPGLRRKITHSILDE